MRPGQQPCPIPTPVRIVFVAPASAWQGWWGSSRWSWPAPRSGSSLTDPITVAEAVDTGEYAPLVEELADVIYKALVGLIRYL